MSGPFQPLPPLVAGLAVAAASIEAVFQLGAAGMLGGPDALGWRIEAIRAFGFFEPVFRAMLVLRRVEADGVVRFLCYPLLHLGAMHALFGIALLLAMGQAVSTRLRPAAVGMVMISAAVGGAAAYGSLQHGRAPLIGLYPVVYGLIGAFTQGLLVRAVDLRQRVTAFRLAGLLAGLQLVFRLVLGGGGSEWVGDVGGFATGFALVFFVGPGGKARLTSWRDWLRER